MKRIITHSSEYIGRAAFTLVELLISLIIISVITVTFAPIFVKKIQKGEIALGQTGIVSYNSKTFTGDSEWEIPARVRRIKVTSIAGGGAGGGASFGSKEITSTQNWIVPAGVTKIKVYMTGAGGGGANGIQGTPAVAPVPASTITKYGSIPSLSDTVGSITTAGTYDFTDIAPPSNYKAPSLASGCSGVWTYLGATVYPDGYIAKFPNDAYVTITNIKACGGGGGGSGGQASYNGGAGGSGGYLEESQVISNTASNIKIIIAKGGSVGFSGHHGVNNVKGGAGGSGATNGANGGNAVNNQTMGATSGGGGGGGSTAIYNSITKILEAPGGGGGAGIANTSNVSGTTCGGNGGNGGGANAGSGGVRRCITHTGQMTYSYSSASGQNGVGGAGGGSGTKGANGVKIYSTTDGVHKGGSGGGGTGGKGGTNVGGVLDNNVFTSNNCNGGDTDSDGKSGAIKLSYRVSSVNNALSCTASTPAVSGTPAVAGRGGGGGGAGQVFVGEIPVTQGQTVTFTVGTGGNAASAGGNTTIAVNGVIKATALGGNAGNGTLGGAARGLNSTNNWLNISSSCGAKGSNGSGESGGIGGGTYLKNNTFASGDSNKYGTGGKGGNATSTSYSAGAKGADGYIYVEWGETNGGGGSSGQVVQVKSLSVTSGQKVNIKIGNGGVCPNEILSDGVYTGQNGNNGNDSYISINGNIYALAKGGLGGKAGNFSTHGKGGNQDNSISDCAKGKDGKEFFGGEGGSITQTMCSLFDSYRGLGGCGGRMTTGMCFGPTSSAEGKAAFFGGGGGGGGGAVKDGVAHKGGEGSVGSVVIEWN